MQNRTRQVLAAAATAACAFFAITRQVASAPLAYSGGDYVQSFDSLSNLPGDTSFPAPGPNDVPNLAGWSFARLAGTNTTINFQVDDGSSTEKGQVGSWGISGSTDRALGSCATTPSTPNFGLQLTNNSTNTFNSFTLSYTGEQWRRATAPANAGFLVSQ